MRVKNDKTAHNVSGAAVWRNKKKDCILCLEASSCLELNKNVEG